MTQETIKSWNSSHDPRARALLADEYERAGGHQEEANCIRLGMPVDHASHVALLAIATALAFDPPPFRGEALTPAALEAGCRALHEMQGTLDADTPMHAPFQKSWEKPSMARWQQWTETVEVVNAAIVASPALVTSGED